MSLEFGWHLAKAATNLRKHGISFEEAATVFLDPDAWTFFDSDHSETDDSFITTGFSNRQRILFLAHADVDDQTMRIISARKATPREREEYAKIQEERA